MLLVAGLGRNAIAREVGVSGSSVSRVARDAGVTFSGAAMTAAATACGRVDAAVVRAQRERELLAAQSLAIAAGQARRVRRLERKLADLHRHTSSSRS
ncbi:hypothetical protein AB1K56_02750 [Microbacterium sp. BWR-S6Y]|uniref:hypothetical protein n=1 Tax=Microbacterium sp. BWR-S6Y TaxID=3232073 RepID=UPI0035290585